MDAREPSGFKFCQPIVIASKRSQYLVCCLLPFFPSSLILPSPPDFVNTLPTPRPPITLCYIVYRSQNKEDTVRFRFRPVIEWWCRQSTSVVDSIQVAGAPRDCG